MTDADLIAAFLAKNGPTRVAAGVRAYDERSMYRAVRGERVQSISQDEEDQRAYAKWERDVQEAFVARHG